MDPTLSSCDEGCRGRVNADERIEWWIGQDKRPRISRPDNNKGRYVNFNPNFKYLHLRFAVYSYLNTERTSLGELSNAVSSM